MEEERNMSADRPDDARSQQPGKAPGEDGTFERRKRSLWKRGIDKLIAGKKALVEAVRERAGEVKHARMKRILVGVFLIAVAVFFVVFYVTVGKKIAFLVRDTQAFKDWLSGFGKEQKAMFVFLRVVQTVLKLIPGEALEICAGCAFGAWEGLVLCLLGTVIGSVIIIFLGKRYGMKLVGLFVSPKRMQSIAFLQDRKRLGFTFFLLYFIPGTPKDMFTWLVCLTDMNPFVFVLITTVARIPSVITSTWCGEALIDGKYVLSFSILAITVLLGIVGGIIYKVALNRRKKAVSQPDFITGEGEKSHRS